jgi:hypothetical protein
MPSLCVSSRRAGSSFPPSPGFVFFLTTRLCIWLVLLVISLPCCALYSSLFVELGTAGVIYAKQKHVLGTAGVSARDCPLAVKGPLSFFLLKDALFLSGVSRPCCSSLDTYFSAQRPFVFAWRPAALGVQWGTGVALQCHGPDQRRMS